ncbi:MAG: hypothetical protein C4532_18615 [Candidatus Abyssobacteria bacterium SURF_17]|jgi:hypothetical protein|uniref:Uncharacterized protein n=1 Tax=Candidatus Abyssobacteria bacterium SURF_17 TaxID=2093361 RepID=A0A419EPE6_9BACT|nr:MAG: hypothetical protein C4532_18615 [Candidatus Abyssubacteria bacterium SURF_17]
MQKATFLKRFVIPAGIPLLTMIVMSLIYHNSWRIRSDALQQIVAHISAVLLFVSIGFGMFVTYPMAFRRGASVGERIIACLVTPLVWNIKEVVRVSEFFTFGECLYYGLNQIFVLSVFGAFAEMGLCELICRWRKCMRAEEPIKIVTPLPLVAICSGIAAFYVILLWGLGVHFFYVYIEGYKALFH